MDIIEEACDGCKFWINNICENESLLNYINPRIENDVLLFTEMIYSKPINFGCKLSKEELEADIRNSLNEVKDELNGNTK